MIDKGKIDESVKKILKVNLGLKPFEKVLVITDVPTTSEWKEKTVEEVDDFVQRAILAKTVSEIARESQNESAVEFFAYPSVGRAGAEPSKTVAEKLKTADVLLAITTHSLTHTQARKDATHAGVRIASMPLVLVETFYPDGPLAADYREIQKVTLQLSRILTEASHAMLEAESGTKLSFSLEGRNATADTGILTDKGAVGNLPAGEAFIAPVEGTANGKVVVEKGWFPKLEENMILAFRKGGVVDITGGGKTGDELRSLVEPDIRKEPFKSRRNLAELGVGTNAYAKRTDNIIEAEKIMGTAHIAIGTNYYFGGSVRSDLHRDFVVPRPTLKIDGETIMQKGKLSI